MMEHLATATRTDELPQRVLIVGLGKTGLSCARYLSRLGVPHLAVTDSREQPPGLSGLRDELPDVGLFLGDFDQAIFAATDMLVVSPGVPLSTPEIQYAHQQGVPVVGDIELFARHVQAPVAAITGSNGKSTVTTLLGVMAATAGRNAVTGGNLGRPALDLLDELYELYLLELSSFQLETTRSLAPEVAVVLNVSPDHMDRYADLQDYARVKSRIYANARSGVYNLDDPMVMAMPRTPQAWSFTLDEPRDDSCFGIRQQAGEAWLCRGQQALLPANALLMPGRHNLANGLAALALGTALGLPMDSMLEALQLFPGLAHRTEYLGEYAGVNWYNDSKGTNPGATIAALQGLRQGNGGRTVLIAGGECKGADFTELANVIEETCRGVVLMGVDRQQIGHLLDDDMEILEAGNMDEAVLAAARLAQAGDRVLLSPACASFDMFKGFEHRGTVFKETVKRLMS